MRDFRVEQVAVGALKPAKRNARTHSKKQIHEIAASITEFGFTNPVLADQKGRILAGHGRFEAAKLLGLPEVPVIRLEHLSEEQKRAYALVDNKLALNAGWDLDMLAADLKELSELELPFDLEITGFSTAEIDQLVDGSTGHTENDPLDSLPALGTTAIARLNDLWLLGDHKLLCADAREASAYETLLGAEKARIVFADPPYNVPIDGHVGGLGSVKHREFAMAAGEMTERQFTDFLENIFRNAAGASLDGAIHFICMDWRHIGEVLAAGRSIYSELKNICVWNKDNGGMGSFYRSKHEFVFVFKVGSQPHVNTVELGRTGRYRTNVWDYAGVNTLRAGRSEELAMHPTVKPTALVIHAIKDCSRRGEIVLDPFSGSGTTIIAAEKSRRLARVVEIDPLYVDVAVRRWQALTGRAALLATSGETFDRVAEERARINAGTPGDAS
jgi:ParB-like chromosome segregation protein Spo0J